MAETPKPLSVRALNAYVAELVASDGRLRNLRVVGEVSNFKRHSSGHLYFSLKDAYAVVRCVMFRASAARVKFDIVNGANVCVRGTVAVYERDGQYQLYVQDIEPQGAGLYYEKFEALKAKLAAEGLFASEAKKPIPRYVRAVGVVTSPTGAAVRDIIHVLTRRNDSVKITVCPANVQGTSAAAQIARGIRVFNRLGRVDVIILGRGGGSIEELWAFNEEIVARTIASSRIPVISAVGHETDFTLADFAADLRAPTPSAAAELAVTEKSVLLSELFGSRERLRRVVRRKLDKGFSDAEHLRVRLCRMHPEERIAALKTRVAGNVRRLDACALAVLSRESGRLNACSLRLRALGPMQVLSRGYAYTRDAETGGLVTRAGELRRGQKLNVFYRDGSAKAAVEDVHTDGKAGS